MIFKKKYTCVFCSNTNEKSNKKVFFCRDCIKIRNYIRDNGIKTLLNKIECNNNNNKLLEPSCPPY